MVNRKGGPLTVGGGSKPRKLINPGQTGKRHPNSKKRSRKHGHQAPKTEDNFSPFLCLKGGSEKENEPTTKNRCPHSGGGGQGNALPAVFDLPWGETLNESKRRIQHE